MSPEEVLKKYWGYDSFRNPQREIIHSLLDKKDVVGILPTGGGKSVCFQVPALINDGLCLVITPLMSHVDDEI